jgi:hydroxypyruvate reductase
MPGVELIEAGHPYPDENSVRAARRALEIAYSLEAGDQLLVLLSGGGSALLAAPVEGLTLADKQAVTRLLLRSGATIEEINSVRKHLSQVKGGRLAVAAGPARVTTWMISDVPGDDPSFVSSGPTVADYSTLEEARDIFAKYRIAAPASVAAALEDPANETPAADTLGLAGGEAVIVARARDALVAAGALAARSGFAVTDLGDQLQAEARYLGASHAALSRRLAADGQRRVIISGGEATVSVTNPKGRGGRNMEYLLGLAIALAGAPGISALACDTDGIDGTEHAAGAIVVPDTLARARALGIDPAECLASNNAFLFFEALGDLVVTGPTFTNVNDFRAILIEGRGE